MCNCFTSVSEELASRQHQALLLGGARRWASDDFQAKSVRARLPQLAGAQRPAFARFECGPSLQCCTANQKQAAETEFRNPTIPCEDLCPWKISIQGLHAAKMFLRTPMACAIRFTTDNVALIFLFKTGPRENCKKHMRQINIAHSCVGAIAFANR